jgi:hypothetical protein
MLLPSIPVNLVITKDNLLQNNLVSETVANILCFVLPWLIGILRKYINDTAY